MQRTVLARELSKDVRLLIAQNPCLGLDFAANREIRERILGARNRVAAAAATPMGSLGTKAAALLPARR